ncbi:dienelactone hydrolase family protein [Methylobacterium sp. E-066]|uniref:dienelactone hydrolase family protein n=1 Tax=Methylobacterium sp. E-066 TaxID=2836584 RepID=UPI001FB8D4DE|nr:CocE/NonD family hydrolase [Methylobacterium sp. E-066]MCJ2141173.1 dienelactone hydrolase family protein [Methylobacterium sp. E-066]
MVAWCVIDFEKRANSELGGLDGLGVLANLLLLVICGSSALLRRVNFLTMILIYSVPIQLHAANYSKDNGWPLPEKRVILDLTGDPAYPVKLKVGLVLPPGPGPFPLVIWNHGSNGRKGTIDEKFVVEEANAHLNMGVYYFLSRGYAVALPLLRGFGHSGGSIDRTRCRPDDLGLHAAADIEAVLDQLGKRPEIDARRVVVAGVSMGGWNSLAVGTLQDARVAGIISFFGGVRSSPCSDDGALLVQSTRRFGSASRVPSLWLYGENDSFFPMPLWQAMHRAYVEQGGKAEVLNFGPYKSDSHRLLSDGSSVYIFGPSVDKFLNKLGLPSQKLFSDYVPGPPLPSTHYSALDDIEAVPFLSNENREDYRRFLKSPSPRVFLIAPNKAVSWYSEGFDPLARGLATCEALGIECWPYAYNNDVVWAHSTPAPPPTQFAKIEDAAALPYVNDAGRNAYKQFLTLSRPRAFVIAPDGRWAWSASTPDPVAAALALCGKRGPPDCHAYAVDGAVVWPESAAITH